MFDCLPAGNDDAIVIGGLTQHKVECNGKFRIRLHNTDDVDLIIHDVAYIAGLELNRFPLHTAQKGKTIVSDKTDVWLTEGRLFFPWSMDSSELCGTRLQRVQPLVIEYSCPYPPVVTTVLSPGIMPVTPSIGAVVPTSPPTTPTIMLLLLSKRQSKHARV